MQSSVVKGGRQSGSNSNKNVVRVRSESLPGFVEQMQEQQFNNARSFWISYGGAAVPTRERERESPGRGGGPIYVFSGKQGYGSLAPRGRTRSLFVLVHYCKGTLPFCLLI